MQQVYNCTLVGTPGYAACQNLSQQYMISMFQQAPGIEGAILATYTLAVLGKILAKDPRAIVECTSHGSRCAGRAMEILRSMVYTFDEYDPEELYGFEMRFDKDSQTQIHVVSGLQIEGTQIIHDAKLGLVLHKVRYL